MSLAFELGCENTTAFDGRRCDWQGIHRLHGPVEPGCPNPSAHHKYQNRAAEALGLAPDDAMIAEVLAR